MSQSADSVMSLTIDGRALREWTAGEARQTAQRKFVEGEALLAAANPWKLPAAFRLF